MYDTDHPCHDSSCNRPDELTRLRAEVAAKDDAIATWGETVTSLQRENESLRKQIAEQPDTRRLNWLEGELEREDGRVGVKSLFRLNQPITREAIDRAMEKAE